LTDFRLDKGVLVKAENYWLSVNFLPSWRINVFVKAYRYTYVGRPNKMHKTTESFWIVRKNTFSRIQAGTEKLRILLTGSGCR